MRILRLLQVLPIPPMEAMRTRLTEVLTHILNKTEVTKSVNRNNAEHCVLFETVNLIIKQGDASDPTLRAKAVAHLSKFINIREPNIRYLGLETMARLTAVEGTAEAIRKQQATILFRCGRRARRCVSGAAVVATCTRARRCSSAASRTPTSPSGGARSTCSSPCATSPSRRASSRCGGSSSAAASRRGARLSIPPPPPPLLQELLLYLAIADFTIKDEMVLKTAILAERFAPNMRWYVDTVLQLISLAGDSVSDDIWHRVVQIVTNHEDLQKYAASKMFHALELVTAHETAVKVPWQRGAGAVAFRSPGTLAPCDSDRPRPCRWRATSSASSASCSTTLTRTAPRASAACSSSRCSTSTSRA